MLHKLRILIATPIYPPLPGGPATHAKQYRDFFNSKETTSVEVVTYGDGESTPGVHRVSRKIPRGLRQIWFSLLTLRYAFSSDVLFALDGAWVGFVVFIASRITGKPYLLRVGGDWLWERGNELVENSVSMQTFYDTKQHNGARMFSLIKRVLLGAELVLVPTAQLARIYENEYGVDSARLVVMANPYDGNAATGERQPSVTKNIIFASRFVSYKNLERLVHAFKKVIARMPDARLFLLGSGPSEAALRALVAELAISDFVVIENRSHASAREEMSRASLCVAPALTEFFPNYAMECLALGVPLVISKEHGLPFPLLSEAQFDASDIKDIERALLWGLTKGQDAAMPEMEGIPSWTQYLERLEGLLDRIEAGEVKK